MAVKKAYRSCFLVDVQIADDLIRLQDSSRNSYYIDASNKDAISSFKSWFKKSFTKAISSNVTVFEYETRNVGNGEVEVFILKFLNCEDDNKLILNESSK